MTIRYIDHIPTYGDVRYLHPPYVLIYKNPTNDKDPNNGKVWTYMGCNAGDIVYYKGDDTSKFYACPWREWDETLGTHIGVVIVPDHHDVYGNGCAGVSSGAIGNFPFVPSNLSEISLEKKEFGRMVPVICEYIKETGEIEQLTGELTYVDDGTMVSHGTGKTMTGVNPSTICLWTNGGEFQIPGYIDLKYQWDGDADFIYGILPQYLEDDSMDLRYRHDPNTKTEGVCYRNPFNRYGGLQQTREIIQKCGTSDTNYAAYQVYNYNKAGLQWYLPTRGEVSYLPIKDNEITHGYCKMNNITHPDDDPDDDGWAILELAMNILITWTCEMLTTKIAYNSSFHTYGIKSSTVPTHAYTQVKVTPTFITS